MWARNMVRFSVTKGSDSGNTCILRIVVVDEWEHRDSERGIYIYMFRVISVVLL